MAGLAGTENREGIQKTHPLARERKPRHKSIPEIAVQCHPPRKTAQLTTEPEEWPKR